MQPVLKQEVRSANELLYQTLHTENKANMVQANN